MLGLLGCAATVAAVVAARGTVAGCVVWIERDDPDGDGDRHLVLVARLHVHGVKLPVTFPVRHLPSLGAAAQATGLAMHRASGRLEISAERFAADGLTRQSPSEPVAERYTPARENTCATVRIRILMSIQNDQLAMYT